MTLLAYLKGILACLKQSCESAKCSNVSSQKEIREAQYHLMKSYLSFGITLVEHEK